MAWKHMKSEETFIIQHARGNRNNYKSTVTKEHQYSKERLRACPKEDIIIVQLQAKNNCSRYHKPSPK